METKKILIYLWTALTLFTLVATASSNIWRDLNFEPSLAEWHIRSDPHMREKCKTDANCKVNNLTSKRCWGFEANCLLEESYSDDHIECRKASNWPGAHTKNLQKLMFFNQGDFGFIRERYDSMETICSSADWLGSSLECSDHLRFCRARNIFFDFKDLNAKGSQRYREDVIGPGQVGGKCDKLNKPLLLSRTDEKSYLQSWGHELAHFVSDDSFNVSDKNCDVIFDRPTVIIKLDASVNMYHHFCDFINLYASQFLNGSFSQDVDIFWWDTHFGGFVDSTFGSTWKAFSWHTPHELIWYDTKKVCFRNAMFSMLARQRMGLYYNMPLVDGCSGSGLFHAFSRHLMHRLGVVQEGPLLGKVRITILSRETAYRKVTNIKELAAAVRTLDNVELKVVSYDRGISFLDQLATTHNSDIFIGMHGSGLTHLLFQPDWGVIFELYNCDDEHCYHDLARLRGVKYWTWTKMDKMSADSVGMHPTLKTPHKKFANYSFDIEEFLRIIKQMVEYVRRHPKFVQEQRRLKRKAIAEEL